MQTYACINGHHEGVDSFLCCVCLSHHNMCAWHERARLKFSPRRVAEADLLETALGVERVPRQLCLNIRCS